MDVHSTAEGGPDCGILSEGICTVGACSGCSRSKQEHEVTVVNEGGAKVAKCAATTKYSKMAKHKGFSCKNIGYPC